MIVLADNDCRGAVAALRRIVEASWAEESQELSLTFRELEEVGLSPQSSDLQIWDACQRDQMVLITSDRSHADGPDSLDEIIRTRATATSLPVLTIGDATRVVYDRAYAEACVYRMMDHRCASMSCAAHSGFTSRRR
jgi:predicted nuclease of predicted toxin-antitoxin system